MADRYWRGGTGTWNSSSTTNWSATSGGAGGASVPTSADDVYFNAASGTGTVTLSGSIVCRSLNFTGTTLTFTGSGSVFLEYYGNFTMGTGATLGANLGQLQHRAAGGTWTFTSNGKTLPWSVIGFYGSASAVMNIQDAITTTGQLVPSGANTVNFGAFTHTCATWSLSGAQTSNFTSPGKVVISRSTTGDGVTTPSSSLTNYAISTYNRFEVLSPPAGITVTNSGWGRVETRTPKLYFIASGSGTISTIGPTGVSSSMGAPWLIEVGAGSYTVNGLAACRSVTVSSSFTGTINGRLAMFSVDSTGCTVDLGTPRTINSLFYAFAVNSGTNPNYLDTSATFTDDGGSFSLITNGILTLRNNAVLSVKSLQINPTLANSNIDFGSGSGKIVVSGINFQLDAYTNLATGGFLNPKPIELVPPVAPGIQEIKLPEGQPDKTKLLSFRTVTGGGTGTVRFNSITGVSITNASIKNLQIADAVHTVSFTNYSNGIGIDGNLTFDGTSAQNTVFNGQAVVFTSSTSPQTLTTNGAVLAFFPYLSNTSTSALTLASNVTFNTGPSAPTSPITIWFGGISLGSGTGFLDLNNFTLTASGIRNLNTINIAFGTGKIRLRNSQDTQFDLINITSDTEVGTLSGSKTIEVEAHGLLAQAYYRTVYCSITTTTAKNFSLRVVDNGSTGLINLGTWTGDVTLESGSYRLNGSANTSLASNMAVYGLLSFLGSTYNFIGGTGTFVFQGSLGTTLNTNGNVVSNVAVINFGSTNTLAGAASIFSYQLDSGTTNLSSFTLTCSWSFSSSNSLTRTLNFGTGSIYLSATTSNTVWDFSNVTSLTVTGTSRKVFITSPSSGQTKTISVSTSFTEGFDYETVSVGTGGTISFSSGNFRNLDVAGGTYTLNLPASYNITGDLTVNGAITSYTGGGSAQNFTKTSGTQLINTNGNTFGGTGPITFNVLATTLQLNGNSNFAASAFNHNQGTLNLNNFRLTVPSFVSTSGSTRTIAFGTSGAIRVTGSGTVFNTSTITGLTVTGTNRFVEPNLNSSQTLTFGNLGSSAFDVSVPSTASNNTLTFTSGMDVRSLTFANVAYTVANVGINVYGGLTVLGTTPTFTAGANTWSFLATTGPFPISLNNVSLGFPLSFSGVGGIWRVDSNGGTTAGRATTLLNGTFDLNNFTWTTGFFDYNNSNTKSVTFGSSGSLVVNGSINALVGSPTGTTFTGSKNVTLNMISGSVTLNPGALSESNALNITVANTSSNFTVTFSAGNYGNLTFGNTFYTVANSANITIFGNVAIQGTSPTFSSGTFTWTFAATSGTRTIQTSAKTLDFPITFNGVGGTWQLSDALTMGSTQTMTLTNGTFNANNFNVTLGAFSSNNSNVRALTMGTGTWTIPNSGTIWDITTSTNMTLTRGASGSILMTSASGKNFNAGGLIYPVITQGGSGSLIVDGNNSRFRDVTRTHAGATTIIFVGPNTYFFDDFTLTGFSAAARTTFNSGTGSQHILSKSSGTVSCDFLNISFSNATGGAAWYAGTGSQNSGNNTGWIFTAPPQASGNMLMVFM